MNLLIKSNIKDSITDYYVLNDEYKGGKLAFTDSNQTLYYSLIRFNTSDYKWYVIQNGKMQGFINGTDYNYVFEYEKYFNFDIQKPIDDYYLINNLEFRLQGFTSTKMIMLFDTTEIVQPNINDGYFIKDNLGQVYLNDISQIDDYICDFKFVTNFWNRQNGDIYNYQTKDILVRNTYFPITVYKDYDAYVIFYNSNGEIIKQVSVGNGSIFDYSTEYLWITEDTSRIEVFEYNSDGYNQISNGVNPNLYNDSQTPHFVHMSNPSYVTETKLEDKYGVFNRYTPSTGQRVSIMGGLYTYTDPKALYVVSAMVRVQTDQPTATVAMYINTDFFDTVNTTSNVTPYKWTQIQTNPFALPIISSGGLDNGYIIINNDTSDDLNKIVDIKNVKIEKVDDGNYRNYIGIYQNSDEEIFAQEQIYLKKDIEYTFKVNGNNNNAEDGAILKSVLRSNDSSEMVVIDIINGITSDYTTIIPLTTGVYYLESYYYGGTEGEGSVYLQDYYIFEGTQEISQLIPATTWIPSSYDMKEQTNIKTKTYNNIKCEPHKESYHYLNSNGVNDSVVCDANKFEVENIERDYISINNKKYNNKITKTKQIRQNTGYSLSQNQIYDLNNTPFIYKYEPENCLMYKNILNNTLDTYTITNSGWINIPLLYPLTPGKTYYLQFDKLQTSETNLEQVLLNKGDAYAGSYIVLNQNQSFVATSAHSKLTHLAFVNNYGYTPYIFGNVKLSEYNQKTEYCPVGQESIVNKIEYYIDNSSFDGYLNKKLSEKNVELILIETKQFITKPKINIDFFD